MNKKLNSILFIIGATIVNLAMMAILSIIPLLIIWNTSKDLDQIASALIGILILMVAVLVSFLIYNKLVKIFTNKVALDKYFDPLFVKTIKKK